MRLQRILRQRLRSLFRRTKAETELEREISLHIEQLTHEYIADGMSETEASLVARRAFGPTDLAKEQCRDMRRTNFVEEGIRDLAYAARLLKKSPGFTLTAVLSLALGIGANTAIFSLVQKVILELLPVRDPHSLVQISGREKGHSSSLSNPLFRDFQSSADLPFEGFLAFSSLGRVTLLTESGAEQATAEVVSGNYFDLLGVPPALGRLFNADDDHTAGAHPVVVLSHKFWIRRFGGDSSVLNKTVRLSSHPFTIVGVSAAGFDGLDPGVTPDVRTPIAMERELGYSPVSGGVLARRGSSWLNVIGRLKPGVTHAQAADTLMPIYLRDRESRGWTSGRIEITSAAQGRRGLRARFEQALWALTAIVGTVLLLACANIAHLLLARASLRQRELSVRAAIGASRGRIVRQLLTESLLLALLGGILGVAIAQGFSTVLVNMVVSDRLHSTLDLGPNPLLLAFNFAIALMAGILFGLVPAVRGSRPDLIPALKGGAHSGEGGRLLGRKLLMSFQVAVSLVLLIGAGLFLRTIQSLRDIDTGFRTENVLQFGLDPVGYPREQVYPFYERVRERIGSLPGVLGVAVARQRLVGGERWSSGISVEGVTLREDDPAPNRDGVSSGYFAVTGIPLVAGREFDSSDHPTSPKVAIVNQAFARYYFGKENPLGKRIGQGGSPPEHSIVGIVRDTKYANIRERTLRFWYVPYQQLGTFHAFNIVVRTSRDPEPMTNAIRQEVAAVDKNLALYGVSTVEKEIDDSLMRERLLATLSIFFAGLAALLAAIGLFGVLSYSVSQREREIGIRMAVGARPSQATWVILRDVVTFAGLGLAAGVAASLALSRFVATLLFGIKPNDPIAIAGACCAMLLIAALGALIPARRAAAIEPAVAFRAE
jgi:predicted permease